MIILFGLGIIVLLEFLATTHSEEVTNFRPFLILLLVIFYNRIDLEISLLKAIDAISK